MIAPASVPVLVVDDNPAKRLALKAVLLPLGYSIVEADSGEEALRCVMAQDFAVILLDVCMPHMDGFETAALIRQRQQSEMTPIIFVTAYASDEIANTDHYTAGAVDFMFAPVPPDEIRAKVSVFANLFLKAETLAVRAKDVQASADQLRLLTDAAPIGIFQVDAQKRYVYTNPRWSEIMGIPSDHALGQTWGDAAAVPTELGQRVTVHSPDDDELRTLLVTSKPISNGSGGTTGWVGTVADVSADARVEEALSGARDAANEASRLKSDFLANMSHEIRTPMNGVIGMTDLLLETDLDARQRDFAQTVRNSGEALLTIIDDILDFSKIEAGRVEIEAVDFDVHAVVDDVVGLLAGQAEAQRLELIATIDASVPSAVTGDPGRVRQVLTNLIGNAIKFTPTGEIVVKITASEGVGPDTLVRFEVKDTGVGIEPDHLEAIFEPFVQADTSTSRRYGGTGLGLAISGQLVALMGGECGVSSTVGSGSTFWFTVRVRAGEAPAAADPMTQGLVGVSALIVDDNATHREVLSDYLTTWGMAVLAAGSGEAALALMRAAAGRESPIAVALVDLSMPGMDGRELCNAIALDPALTARTVLMNGLGQRCDDGDSSAVSASLSKPVRRDDLLVSLRLALGLAAPEDVSSHNPARRTSRAPGREPGLLLLAEDNPINQKVAVAMLTGAGHRVDTVSNGAAAVEAVVTGHYDAVLMDCQMPELSGYEATAAIRSREGAAQHTPIIALTAGARAEDRERCLAEGMDGYLAKPLNKDLLLALVDKTLKSTRSTTDSHGLPDVVAAEVTIDPAVLNDLFAMADGGGQDFVADLVTRFLTDTEARLVELGAAVETGDAPSIGRLAHLIQGSAAQMGGRRLALSCRRLENSAATGLTTASTDTQGVDMDYQDLRDTLLDMTAPADNRDGPRHE
jgi:PAS domain S-box-containing protein